MRLQGWELGDRDGWQGLAWALAGQSSLPSSVSLPLFLSPFPEKNLLDPDHADNHTAFKNWLQCYGVPGMSSLRDHNGRTIWFQVGWGSLPGAGHPYHPLRGTPARLLLLVTPRMVLCHREAPFPAARCAGGAWGAMAARSLLCPLPCRVSLAPWFPEVSALCSPRDLLLLWEGWRRKRTTHRPCWGGNCCSCWGTQACGTGGCSLLRPWLPPSTHWVLFQACSHVLSSPEGGGRGEGAPESFLQPPLPERSWPPLPSPQPHLPVQVRSPTRSALARRQILMLQPLR